MNIFNILDKNPTISFILATGENQDILSDYNNKMLFLDGFEDNCLIGVRIKSGCNIVAAYDDSMCIQSLIEVDDMDEMAATLSILSTNKTIFSGKLVTIHDSGGERELVVDMCEDMNISFADISQKTKKLIKS